MTKLQDIAEAAEDSIVFLPLDTDAEMQEHFGIFTNSD
jgi:hypothetical protein